MKRHLIVIPLLLIASASDLWAQRGMGRGGRRGGGDGEGGRGVLESEAIKEDALVKIDPARVLLDKAKDLRLTDAQKRALDTVATRFDWNSRIFARQVDSLAGGQRASRAERRDSVSRADTSDTAVQARRRALRDALQSLRDEFNGAMTRATDKLDDAQRATATALLNDDRSRFEDLLNQPRLFGGH
jgi:hypothetical protein